MLALNAKISGYAADYQSQGIQGLMFCRDDRKTHAQKELALSA